MRADPDSAVLPPPVIIAILIPVAGTALALALGRRDGLSLDAWLLAAVRHTRHPHRLAPAPTGRPGTAPAWAPAASPRPAAVPVLRLPATAIGDTGVIDTDAHAVALVACSTVNIGLRTGEEQAALIDGYGAWLNSLSTPVQIVVSAHRVDLSSHAHRITDAADTITTPALAAAARDYATFLSRLFRVGLYLCVHAPTTEELEEAVGQVRATAASLLLDVQPATWRQLQGWTTALPLASDGLGMRRIMDTDAVAAAFPLASPDLPAPLPGQPSAGGGLLYGLNLGSNGVVWWDRWAQDNANSVVLARSGAGKSYFVKLEVLRSLVDGVHVAVIDPDSEYLRLADAVGGVTIALGAGGVRLNPLDIPPGDRRPQARTHRALFLHTLVAVLLGQQPPPVERAALDKAITHAYDQAGISNDPATWRRQAPLLRDVAAALAEQHTDAADTLAARLTPWTTGSFKDLFDGPTTTVPSGQLVCWSTRQLADELRAPGMLLALDAIWRDVDTPTGGAGQPPRRLVVVDEAWTLLRDGHGAAFLGRLAKSARKRGAGLAVITQDVGDLLSSDLGQVVIANAATHVLLRQAPQAIDAVADAFGLTAGEARLLLSARRGDGLLLSGTHRVGFHAVASTQEHRLCIGDRERSDEE